MNSLRTQPRPNCSVCNTPGIPLYQDMIERLHDLPGQWNLSRCPNPDCALLWLDPMPVPDDIHLAYQRYFTHQTTRSLKHRVIQYIKQGYLARHHSHPGKTVPFLQQCAGLLAYATPFRRGNADKLTAYLSAAPTGRLLDVGCGDGAIVEFMQQKGWQAEGLDFDPIAIERARAKGLTAHTGTIEAQQYPDNTFAAIVMSHFIEHVHHPAAILQETHRILRPGGRLILLTPNTQSWAHRRYRSAWLHLDPPRHLHIFNPASLQTLLQRAGFRQLTITTSLRNIGRIITASRAIQRHGRCAPSMPRPLLDWLCVPILELAAWRAWKQNPGSGEEIAIIAEKQPATR